MNDAEIEQAVAEALAPKCFTIHTDLCLFWDDAEETLFWEIYQGRLMGQSMTREQRRFHAWNVWLFIEGQKNGPIISVKRDLADGTLHVTRGLLCFGHRVVATGNVIESVEAQNWTFELVGSIRPDEFSTDQLQRELTHLVYSAVVGTGRLPLTSIEAPLPDFSFGRLGYFPAGPEYFAKLLEFLLRSGADDAAILDFVPPTALPQRLREVFLGISLSPYTDFVSRVLTLLRNQEALGAIAARDRVDFLSWLLRLQWRHLNAYDLFVFHHRGANYPDALLIDEALRDLIECANLWPELFAGPEAKLRRRGLRLGWLMRAIYAGHRVPSQPTSPGENQRVLPTPWERVSEEEIFNPYRRSRELFTEALDTPRPVEELLTSAMEDLMEADELQELGTALLLDRPLGTGKALGQPDQTPVLAYVARSRKLAIRHLDAVAKRNDPYLPPTVVSHLRGKLSDLAMAGIKLMPLNRLPRSGVVSLDDAFQTADDFVVERTTVSSAAAFRAAFDLSPLGTAADDPAKWPLILPVRENERELLRVIDEAFTPWLDLEIDASRGFQTRCGVELPIGGLEVVSGEASAERARLTPRG
ncbi:MAG: hypothetical protein ACJ8C4_13615 [Gemmataceae bacterium]